MQTLFVTGADGFVGSHLIEYFRQRGYEVVAGVRNRARKLAMERRSCKALVCDVADAINMARAIASVRPDGVIHLASTSHAGQAAAEPLGAYQSIVTAWANLLDGVRRSVPRARVVLASACDVYGDAGSDGRPLREDTPTQPISTFGSLKAAAETIAQTFYDNYHLNVTIARPFQCLGANQPESNYFGAVARRLTEWDASGGPLEWPDLDVTRDVLHVQDAVEAFERLLVDGKPNEIYNVCSGQPRTCRQIIELMVQASGKPVELKQMAVDDDAPQINALVGDNGKLTALGWQPSRPVEQAARELVRSCEVPATVGGWA